MLSSQSMSCCAIPITNRSEAEDPILSAFPKPTRASAFFTRHNSLRQHLSQCLVALLQFLQRVDHNL